MADYKVTSYIREWLKAKTGSNDSDYDSDDGVMNTIAGLIRSGEVSPEEWSTVLAASNKSMKAKVKAKIRELLADDDEDEVPDHQQQQRELLEMERKLAQKFGLPFGKEKAMGAANDLVRMSLNQARGNTDADDDSSIRVKGIDEGYSTARRVAKHRKAAEHPRYDRPILFRGRPVEELSQLQHAMLGAWFRWKLAKAGHPLVLRDDDRALLSHMWVKEPFVVDDHEQPQLIKGARVKALLDDSSSGGENATPEWFDRMAVTTPLLFGELLPMVTLIEVDRGSSFEGVKFGNVTLTEGSGAAEGTALSLFSTAGMISAVTGSFHTAAIALTIGLDFMEDAAVNVGQTVAELIGEKFAERYDFYIAAGNGTTQPLGIMNTSGTADVTPSNPTTGAIVLNDALDLYFGVGPEYRKRAGARPSYGMTDTTYKRFRSIATGVTGDTRLVMGMDIGSYRFFEGAGETNVAIEQTGLTNSDAFFADMARYRFYRRRGMTLKVETGGKELTTSNLALFYARTRVGGKLVNADAASAVDAFPA